ncbi:hypothetical protein DB31_7126 [Hyalangium minutum]|uniref:Uncharacterized protein n=1 Tax=Hyalangium minutum TaxID=394096 RepID=A0A085WNG1_9BACT|nr:hypothetical protein DB31_7126 [Hyalangium minutum]
MVRGHSTSGFHGNRPSSRFWPARGALGQALHGSAAAAPAQGAAGRRHLSLSALRSVLNAHLSPLSSRSSPSMAPARPQSPPAHR